MLILFPGFDFRDWDRVGEKHGIASVNLHYDDCNSSKMLL